MESTQEQISKTKSDSKGGQMTAILYLLQTHLEEFKNEVDKTYELHKIGEKTKLTGVIEKTINNPIGNLYDISKSIDENCLILLNSFAINFFSVNKDVIAKVYRTSNQGNLHYSIILKKDNAENRNTIFHFFDMQIISQVMYKFPIYFQFTTEENISKIPSAEIIQF